MDLVEQLQTAMSQYQQQGQALIELLGQEQSAIKGNKRETIAELTQQKQQLLTEFQHADKTLFAIIQQFSIPNAMKISDIIEHLNEPAQSQLQPLWESLQATINQARQLNVTNGIAISNRLNSVKHSLDILKGQSSHDVVSYNAKGNLQTGTRTTGESFA